MLRYYHIFSQWISHAFQRFILSILAAGPIPTHVAFIMDGNRRYARSKKKPVPEGHVDGFASLRRVLQMCFRLGIRCVTVYAFSIDNFRRPPDEVEALMILTREKLLELCEQGELLEQYGVRLNVLGRIELLPEDVQASVALAEEKTKKNDSYILNICMPYTSRDEMTRAVEKTVRRVLNDEISINELSAKHIEDALDTSERNLPPVDILVRTSGVKRLSDFLLWQVCENTQINFVSTRWPEFGLFDLIPIILDYQRDQWTSQRKKTVS